MGYGQIGVFGLYPHSLQENTFQAVLITDGNYSYTIFTYKCGLMEWDNEATIGFNAAGNPYENHNPSSSDVACINLEFSDWSNVDYLLSNENPEIPAPGRIIHQSCFYKCSLLSYR